MQVRGRFQKWNRPRAVYVPDTSRGAVPQPRGPRDDHRNRTDPPEVVHDRAPGARAGHAPGRPLGAYGLAVWLADHHDDGLLVSIEEGAQNLDLTPEQAAELLSLKPWDVYKMCEDGTLQHDRYGERILIRLTQRPRLRAERHGMSRLAWWLQEAREGSIWFPGGSAVLTRRAFRRVEGAALEVAYGLGRCGEPVTFVRQ